MKKNVLAVALVAGLGLAGVASAYTYGTIKTNPDAPGDISTPEPVAYQVLTAPYIYTMAEDLVWDIDIGDNIVGISTGFTARMTLQNGAAFDTTNIPAPADLILNPSMAGSGWTIAFDGYYNSGTTVVFRLIPPAAGGSQVSAGRLLAWNNPRLASLDEFAAGTTTVVNGDFWMVNSTNDSEFVNSRKVAPILSRTSGVTACANSGGSEVDKYIDVADDFNEEQIPKTRFSWDGKLGSANDSDGGSLFGPDDYDSQVIDLGDVTIDNTGAGGFVFQAADAFTTVLTGDGGGWAAFENGFNIDDDVYLVNGSCASGTIVDAGTIAGNTVIFNYTAASALLPVAAGAATTNLTVCGFVDTDTVINDQNISVTTTFFRANAILTPTFGPQGCNLLPLRYNGSTMEIFTINPGSNTTQRSFVRLTNRSATEGYVSLEGIDNAGNRGASQVRVLVPAGASVQLDAKDLEDGTNGAIGAWGAGVGKWRAVVTAEFPGLVATSLINTSGDRTLQNMTDSDTRGEQINRDFAEGTWGNEAGQRPSDFIQEWEPDFHGNGSSNGEPGGPNGSDGPSGGQTEADGNPGLD
ncbi:MAG: hypothetical protein EOP93_00385 [Lysobacteraceae bacterium]|nr:MAG: hypothetical protein EOP93_00385 [Xanthomonadaceae bacterium]